MQFVDGLSATILLVFVSIISCEEQSCRPHIVILMIDDAGYGDVSYHGAEYNTPNIDELAREGVRLENYYVQEVCSPTRAAFISGQHPSSFGLRSIVSSTGHGMALPISINTLPSELKQLGYETHQVGKWHLGHSSRIFTPTNRGFDTSFGLYGAGFEYFTHDRGNSGRDLRMDPRPPGDLSWWGYDLWLNEEPIGGQFEGEYSTFLFRDYAINVIEDHKWISEGEEQNPLFIWVSFTNPHSPWQAPFSYINSYCNHIEDESRRIYCGSMTAADDAIGDIINALKVKGYLDDTLILFTSDNGASIVQDVISAAASLPEAGSNRPLRNGKGSFFDGGVKVAAVVKGNMLDDSVKGTVNNELFHVADWYLTLLDAAGGNPTSAITAESPSGELLYESHNQWESLRTGTSGPRNDMFYGITVDGDEYAVRNLDYKLIFGVNNRPYDGWFGNFNSTNQPICLPFGNFPLCSELNPPFFFFKISEDPEERRPITVNAMTSEEQQNFDELTAFANEWRSTIPLSQNSVTDSQGLPVYWGCSYSPWISFPGFPVTPKSYEYDGSLCHEYGGRDHWMTYA